MSECCEFCPECGNKTFVQSPCTKKWKCSKCNFFLVDAEFKKLKEKKQTNIKFKNKKITAMQTHRKHIELKYYQGSLDFPCDFCNSNSYRNFHLTINGDLIAVICEGCLNRCKIGEDTDAN